MKTSLTITTAHLDAALALHDKKGWDVCRHCILAQAAREHFGVPVRVGSLFVNVNPDGDMQRFRFDMAGERVQNYFDSDNFHVLRHELPITIELESENEQN